MQRPLLSSQRLVLTREGGGWNAAASCLVLVPVNQSESLGRAAPEGARQGLVGTRVRWEVRGRRVL